MKKGIAVLLSLLLLLLTAGCGAGEPETTETAQGIEPAADYGAGEPEQTETAQEIEPAAADYGAGEPETTETAQEIEPAAPAKIDVDLTTLSSTMVYSEVYNMMNTPQDYIGKTVKAKGPFAVYHDEANDNYFFAVRISDATACCAQGLEFVWAGNHKYPNDYPEQGTEIVITGKFNTYMDGVTEYSHLENATMEISKA